MTKLWLDELDEYVVYVHFEMTFYITHMLSE